MKKNVTILDLLGNMIGTTYPKRAKGLVKSGRACLIDGETVQLITACPPDQSIEKQQEDIHMEIKKELAEDQTTTIKEQSSPIISEIKKEDVIKMAKEKEDKKTLENQKRLLDSGISLQDIFRNLDTIRADSSYIHQALTNLEKLPYIASADTSGDTSISARAEAIADIVKCRETTNQMMIKLYTQVYTDYMS